MQDLHSGIQVQLYRSLRGFLCELLLGSWLPISIRCFQPKSNHLLLLRKAWTLHTLMGTDEIRAQVVNLGIFTGFKFNYSNNTDYENFSLLKQLPP